VPAKQAKPHLHQQAVILLCGEESTDHLQNFVYDQCAGLMRTNSQPIWKAGAKVPDYAFDCHTQKGARDRRRRSLPAMSRPRWAIPAGIVRRPHRGLKARAI
jgi:hypothetical protein